MDVVKLPDVAAMLKIEAQISSFSNKSALKALPVVREKLHDLNRMISNANNVIRAKVVVGVVAINNQFSEGEAVAQDQLKATEWEEELVRLRKKLAASLLETEKAIKAVTASSAPDTIERQADLQRDREKQRLALALVTASKAEQELRLTELNDAIEVLEKPSLYKVFKNLIPQPEDVDAIIGTLKLTALDATLVKAAIEKVNKNLEDQEEGRKFADLVSARRQLRERIAELQVSVLQAALVLEKTEDQITQYEGVAAMSALKAQWLEEAGAFQQNWQSRQVGMAELSQASALVSALKDLLNYLVEVRLQFEAN